MDWIVTFNMKKQGMDTSRLQDAISEFVEQRLPPKGAKEKIKFRLSQGEAITLLDAISVEVKLWQGAAVFCHYPMPRREKGQNRRRARFRRTKDCCKEVCGAASKSVTTVRTTKEEFASCRFNLCRSARYRSKPIANAAKPSRLKNGSMADDSNHRLRAHQVF